MTYNLLTRDESNNIVENTDTFYKTVTVVEGYNVEMYDYRLVSHSDFIDNNSYELRGLTFVEVTPGVWERNLLMNKFFNVNQTNLWNYEDLKNKKIVRVQDKLDGSIISFIRFPNGVVRAKSKMSFNSDQAVMAQKIYDNDKRIRSLIETAETDGYICIFELVSPDNQIVLEYDETNLILLQMRKMSDGTYANKSLMKSYLGIWELKGSQDYHIVAGEGIDPLEWLLKEKETQENIEGWIVTFDDGQMAKIKTNWYLKLHGLVGPDAFRENLLVETILDGYIDDVISNLVPGVKKDKIVEMSEKVEHEFNRLVASYKSLRDEYFNVFNSDRKSFAMSYSQKHPLFGYVIKSVTLTEDIEKLAEKAAREYILGKTKTLSEAKEWLYNL